MAWSMPGRLTGLRTRAANRPLSALLLSCSGVVHKPPGLTYTQPIGTARSSQNSSTGNAPNAGTT